MFFSLIIPVYNVEKYLHQCIDSVINQNIGNLEIILVDDGSTDESKFICDQYAANYEFIKVIHKENGGLSSARNAGINAATGEYLIFMDSDDWWNENIDVGDALSTVYENNHIDMFLFTSLDYFESNGLYKRKEHNNLSQLDFSSNKNYYKSLIENGNYEVSACTKVLNKKFIKENNLYFKERIKGEDNEWTIRLLRKLNSVKLINSPIYICRMNREGSITSTIKKENVIDLLNIIKSSIDFYATPTNAQDYRNEEFCFCAYLWFVALGLTGRVPSADKKELFVLFKETKEVCKYSHSRKTRICSLVMRVLGLTFTAWLLGKYITLKNKKVINRIKVD